MPTTYTELSRRSTRERRPSDIVCQVNTELSNFNEIKLYPAKDQVAWQEAMNRELKSLKNLEVYKDVKLPPGERAIGCKWVYKIKPSVDGTVSHKARLVAQGFVQSDMDYDEVFAPSLRANTLRAALVCVAKNKYKINHVDVETAYLHAPLQHTVYMKKPLGLKDDGKTDYWKLKKSLYGLKQSSYEWNKCIVKELVSIGFEAGIADPCLFRREKDGLISLLLLFTDDIAIITKAAQEANDIVYRLQKRFRIRNLGEIEHYLGLDIVKTNKGFKISQAKKISQLLKCYNMEHCKTAKTLMSKEFTHSDIKSPMFDKEIYQSLIGSLSYLGNWCRTDIYYSVNQMARYNAEPNERILASS
uniref:Reverse transcriptase Ty1/copia-type domain-containing protein n=2 Tax=Micrurus surinamensis TaxID=129470 RepID=A0A2D4NPE1_MICSU